ncbi:MAG: porin [Proteobacteria bacterium]|nr:porin [Pseudomonadota bacterium]
MRTQGIKLAVALMTASALIAPQAALAKHKHAAPAKSKHEIELEARLARLEAEVSEMRAAAAAARGGQAQADAGAQAAIAQAQAQAAAATASAQAAQAKAAETATKLAALEKKPAPEGMRSGATTIKLGGFLKMEAANSHWSNGPVTTNTLGRDFYLPSTIPTTAGGHSATSQDFNAKQARLWLNLDTQVAGHVVKGYVETDFQVTASAAQNVTAGGSQRTTNGYTLGLRRAYIQVDRFTLGQDWTTFQYVAALPESTDYVGPTEGTVFVRQPQVRYSTPLAKNAMLHIALENPESALTTAGSPTLVENGTDRMPDITARLALTGAHGELSLAGLVRQVRAESTGTALTNAGSGLTATGVGGSVAGKLWLNKDKSADLRFMATYGQNIGRYVGLNFAPDALYLPTTNSLSNVKVFATMAALHLPLTARTRVNLMGGYQNVGYDNALTAAQNGTFNKKAWSLAANLFYSPVKAIDVGIEYRHGERDLVNGASGTLDRVEFAAKYSF